MKGKERKPAGGVTRKPVLIFRWSSLTGQRRETPDGRPWRSSLTYGVSCSSLKSKAPSSPLPSRKATPTHATHKSVMSSLISQMSCFYLLSQATAQAIPGTPPDSCNRVLLALPAETSALTPVFLGAPCYSLQSSRWCVSKYWWWRTSPHPTPPHPLFDQVFLETQLKWVTVNHMLWCCRHVKCSKFLTTTSLTPRRRWCEDWRPTHRTGRALLWKALASAGLRTTHSLPALFWSSHFHHVQAMFDNIRLVSLEVLHLLLPSPGTFWPRIFPWVDSLSLRVRFKCHLRGVLLHHLLRILLQNISNNVMP